MKINVFFLTLIFLPLFSPAADQNMLKQYKYEKIGALKKIDQSKISWIPFLLEFNYEDLNKYSSRNIFSHFFNQEILNGKIIINQSQRTLPQHLMLISHNAIKCTQYNSRHAILKGAIFGCIAGASAGYYFREHLTLLAFLGVIAGGTGWFMYKENESSRKLDNIVKSNGFFWQIEQGTFPKVDVHSSCSKIESAYGLANSKSLKKIFKEESKQDEAWNKIILMVEGVHQVQTTFDNPPKDWKKIEQS